MKTAFVADAGDRITLLDEIPGKKKAFRGQIVSDGVAVFLGYAF